MSNFGQLERATQNCVIDFFANNSTTTTWVIGTSEGRFICAFAVCVVLGFMTIRILT